MAISGDDFGTDHSSLVIAVGHVFRMRVLLRFPVRPSLDPFYHSNPVPAEWLTKFGGRPTGVPPGALSSRQPACKPGSVWHASKPACVTAIPLGRRLPGASSNLPGRPDLDTIPKRLLAQEPRAAPIRSCSRWGLPCRRRCRRRGALLPHRFTLTVPARKQKRRSVLCGTVPGFASAGRYPAPLVHGARTFLPGNLSVSPERPSGRLTRV
jgi:hypothetical protein